MCSAAVDLCLYTVHTAAVTECAFLPLATFIDCCTELIIEAKLRIAATFDTYSSSIHASCIYSWTSLYLIENIDIHFFCQLRFCAVCILNPILIEQLHVCVYVKRITGHCNCFLSLCCLSNLVTRRRCKRWAAVQIKRHQTFKRSLEPNQSSCIKSKSHWHE